MSLPLHRALTSVSPRATIGSGPLRPPKKRRRNGPLTLPYFLAEAVAHIPATSIQGALVVLVFQRTTDSARPNCWATSV